jgi:hypothetical protein
MSRGKLGDRVEWCAPGRDGKHAFILSSRTTTLLERRAES